MSTQRSVPPPVAEQRPVERTHHGDVVSDPYEWLRDKEDPKVIAHLEDENAYSEAQTAHLADLREAIFTEIKTRTQETDLSVPTRKGAWWYYTRTVEGQQYALHCRCPVRGDDDWDPPVADTGSALPGEEVLLDGNQEAAGQEFFAVGTFEVSSDGHRLAYSVDTTGDERFTLRVKDLRTSTLLPDEIANTSYSSAWSGTGDTVFYLTVDDSWRPATVWRHRLGTPATADDVVFHEPDERFWVDLGTTRSERFLVIASASKLSSEVRLLDATTPDAEPRLVAPRRPDVEYSVEHAVVAGEDRLLILHNDGAPNFTLAEASIDDADPQRWRTLIAPRVDTRLGGVAAFAGFVAVSLRRDALARVAVLRLGEGGYGEPAEVAFDEELFSCDLGGNPDWHQPYVRLSYTSFVTPRSVYDYDVAAETLQLRKQQPVLGGYQPSAYEQHREWALAVDGTRIPVSVVCRAGTPRDGTAPCVLYGYGSYEISIDPAFDIVRLSLLDRGVVYAVAHVRGGGEMGRGWYDDGKLLSKTNTFTDFVACARHLAAQGWTSPQRLVAMGGSAGGLLVGAATNLAPDAFAGVLAIVPFVDALTTILDPTLPLTVTEWDEWGDPLHDPDVYAYMKSYTPYENVTATAHPAILAMTSLNDTRVLFVEPAKWVARLRELTTGTAPVLLKTEMVAGHAGKSGRYEAWRERAYMYAWALDVLAAAQPVGAEA